MNERIGHLSTESCNDFRVEDNIPELCTNTKLLSRDADEVPIYWAVMDNGSTTFYSFNFIELPVDLTSPSIL